mmetsp:Transcript_35481/g.90649  ORF Transcript_35481/g.90649 Transcript_35481/m.90649 type:complete len:220 (-) Transcript_35481:202-861(-)
MAQFELAARVRELLLFPAEVHPVAREARLLVNLVDSEPAEHSRLHAGRGYGNEENVVLEPVLDERGNGLEGEGLGLEGLEIVLEQWVCVFVWHTNPREQHPAELDAQGAPELEVWPLRLALAPRRLHQRLGHELGPRADLVLEARGCLVRCLRGLMGGVRGRREGLGRRRHPLLGLAPGLVHERVHLFVVDLVDRVLGGGAEPSERGLEHGYALGHVTH